MGERMAAARARWLAELRAALDQAERLARVANQAGPAGPDFPELIARIDAARRAIRALQLRGQRMPADFDPKWTHPSGSEASIADLG